MTVNFELINEQIIHLLCSLFRFRKIPPSLLFVFFVSFILSVNKISQSQKIKNKTESFSSFCLSSVNFLYVCFRIFRAKVFQLSKSYLITSFPLTIPEVARCWRSTIFFGHTNVVTLVHDQTAMRSFLQTVPPIYGRSSSVNIKMLTHTTAAL